MAKKPNGFWIYAIEINPEWIPHLHRRKVPRDTQRLIYVGYTETGPRERFEQHMLGLHHPTKKGAEQRRDLQDHPSGAREARASGCAGGGHGRLAASGPHRGLRHGGGRQAARGRACGRA